MMPWPQFGRRLFLVLSLKRCCLLQTMTLGNYTSLLNLSDVIIYPNGTLQV